MKPLWMRLRKQSKEKPMAEITTLKKGDEICATVVGWIDSFSWYGSNDVVVHVVDMDGNIHAIAIKSPTTTVTVLDKGQK